MYYAVENNSVECVDALCKQTQNIIIEKQDIYVATENDHVKILQLLVCRLNRKCGTRNWTHISRLESSNIVSSKEIEYIVKKMIKEKNVSNF